MANSVRHDGGAAHASAAELLGQTEWVRELARVISRDGSAADDLAQDALAAALTGRAPSGPGLRPWLAATVRNLARFHRRGDAHRRDREQANARSESAEDHARILAEAEAHHSVVEHVLALDERDRELLLARYFQGRSTAEIARRGGRTLAAVSSQLTRAHNKLRARLEAEGGRDRWLAGLAPLLADTCATGARFQPAAAAFASAWTVGAAALVAAVLALFLWIQSPDPSSLPLDIVPTASDDQAKAANPADEVVLVDAPEREPAAGESVPVGPSPGRLLASVVAAEEIPIPGGHLWIEDGTGKALADRVLGAEGRARFPTLPTRVPLRAYLSVGGDRWPEPIATFEIPSVEEAAVTWKVHLTTRVVLQGVDLDGQPVADQILGIRHRRVTRREFAEDIRKKSVLEASMNDQDGKAVFLGIPPGRYGAGVLDYFLASEVTLPDGTVQINVGAGPRDPGCPVTVPFEVLPNVEHMVLDVLVHRGQRIAGRVVDAGGNGLEGVQLRATMQGVGGALGATSFEDGRFSFGHVIPGTYSLETSGSNDGWVLGDHVSVESGTEDVVLKLVRAGEVELTVTGPDLEGVWIWRARVGAGSTGPRGSGPYKLLDGRLDTTLRNLQPGSHWISAHDANGTHLGVAWPVHVASGREPTICLLDLTRALEVEVVNLDATRAVRSRPDFGEFTTTGGYAAAGDRNVVAVPPGTSKLLLRLDGDAWVPHTVSGAAGDRVTLEVGTPAPGEPAK